MRAIRYVGADDRDHVGVIDGDRVHPTNAADPLDAAVAARIGDPFPLAGAKLIAPLRCPRKYLAVGLNYPLHTLEAGFTPPEYPVIFNKQTSCIIGPGAAIHKPSWTNTLDYEGELGVVIGRDCRNVLEEDALDVIAGYVLTNDISVRAWQRRTTTMTLAKSGDTHGPVGPWFVSRDEIPDPHAIRIRTWVGDALMQDFNTADMLFRIPHLIALMSGIFTLERGDLIATGTGDGIGSTRTPPRWLAPGDVVRIEADGLGVLSNPVVPEPEKCL